VQLTPEREMTVMIDECLSELDKIEAAFLRDCHLHQLKTPLWAFAKRWRLSQKDLTELRSRALDRLKERLAAKNIHSLGDII
jgi:hypothetical protein